MYVILLSIPKGEFVHQNLYVSMKPSNMSKVIVNIIVIINIRDVCDIKRLRAFASR